jgi:hypothetical protein
MAQTVDPPAPNSYLPGERVNIVSLAPLIKPITQLEVELDAQLNSTRIAIDAVPNTPEG